MTVRSFSSLVDLFVRRWRNSPSALLDLGISSHSTEWRRWVALRSISNILHWDFTHNVCVQKYLALQHSVVVFDREFHWKIGFRSIQRELRCAARRILHLSSWEHFHRWCCSSKCWSLCSGRRVRDLRKPQKIFGSFQFLSFRFVSTVFFLTSLQTFLLLYIFFFFELTLLLLCAKFRKQ